MKDLRNLLKCFALLLATVLSACSQDGPDNVQIGKSRTLMLYAAGYNNLTRYFKEDIDDICSGYVPSGFSSGEQLFIFAHLTASQSDYSTPNAPVLMKIYRDMENNVVRDTVKVWPEETCSADAGTFGEALQFIHDNYPTDEFGVIFSSHSTGWLPAGHYNSTSSFRMSSQSADGSGAPSYDAYDPSVNFFQEGLRPQHERDMLPDVKSIGAEYAGGTSNIIEMELCDFAAAIPVHLDYIVFDSCLMGGIEVAYELKDVCDRIVFSPSQVLADGMDYTTIVSRLLAVGTDGTIRVAEDFYNHYNAQSGSYQSATITVVDCTKLDRLAEACRNLFSEYGSTTDFVNVSTVQRLDPTRWFYDFRSILAAMGRTDDELAEVDAALKECILYKAATEVCMGITIKSYSGLSMYLPAAISSGSERTMLDDFYSEFAWNRDAGYVE